MVVTTTYVETLVSTRLAAEVEDQQDDNNRVEIEEHLLEVQEGPLVDENDGDNENNLYDQVNMAE